MDKQKIEEISTEGSFDCYVKKGGQDESAHRYPGDEGLPYSFHFTLAADTTK